MRKAHPARNARILAGWAAISATVVAAVAVTEDAIERVDYRTALNVSAAAPQPEIEPFDLSGSAETVEAAPTVPATQPGDSSLEAVAPPTTQAQITETTPAPPTTAKAKPNRRSKAS